MANNLRVLFVLAAVLTPLAVFAQEFVPLAPIPNLTQGVSTDNLSIFFNALYKFCIGAAAVIAIIQITRGGIMWMWGDSISSKTEARSLITMSILGLILVLAPVLVFSIIGGKSFTSLNIGIDKLQFTPPSTATSTNPNGPITGAAECNPPGEDMAGAPVKVCSFSDFGKAYEWIDTKCSGSGYKGIFGGDCSNTAADGTCDRYSAYCSQTIQTSYLAFDAYYWNQTVTCNNITYEEDDPVYFYENGSAVNQLKSGCEALGGTFTNDGYINAGFPFASDAKQFIGERCGYESYEQYDWTRRAAFFYCKVW